MATHASTLLLLAVVVGVASLASYLLSQWRARHGGETFALAGIGIGTALLLAAVFLVVLGILLFSQQWLARINATSASETAARDTVTAPNPFGSATLEPPSDLEIQLDLGHDPRGIRGRGTSPSDQQRSPQAQESSSRAHADPNHSLALPSPTQQQNPSLLSTSDPWAATRCVVPFKREWDDGTRWTIVNDCGVAVAIVIATCERPASACPNGAWRYPSDALLLPAKVQRTTTEAEETQYANELRHAACVITDPAAVNLIGLDGAARSEGWHTELEAARARDTCLSEARRLTGLGARSGVPIQALLGTALYSRAEL